MTSPQEIKRQDFDVSLPENLGRPLYFNVDQYLSCVEQLVISDEVSLALNMLENMPSYYRDNVPLDAIKLKQHIYKLLTTPVEYVTDVNHIRETQNMITASKEDINKSIFDYIGRAQIIRMIVESLNSQNKIPFIAEAAPGSFWLPIGLAKNDYKFKYRAQSLNVAHQLLAQNFLAAQWAEKPKEDEFSLFICFELIEHLHAPEEILFHYQKHEIEFDRILLSTPKYCVNGGNPTWATTDLGHLRTYTPREFVSFAQKHWPTYKWTLFDNPTLILSGEKV